MIGIKNKGKRPGQRLLQQPESGVINWFYVVRDMTQIIANKREVSLLWLDIPYPADGLKRFMISNIAAHAIYGIGRVNDQPALTQYLRNLLNGPGIRIFGVYLYYHRFGRQVSNLSFETLAPASNKSN